MRKHYGYSRDEWDELPWCDTRMYLQELPEIVPELRHLSYRDEADPPPSPGHPAPPVPAPLIDEVAYSPTDQPQPYVDEAPRPPAQHGLSPGTGGPPPAVQGERPAWLNLPIKRVELPAEGDAA